FRLKLGPHTVRAQISNISGQRSEVTEWRFYVRSKGIEKQQKKEYWQSTGSLGSQYQYSKLNSSSGSPPVTDPNGYATATFEYSAKRGDEELFLGPLFFTTQTSVDLQPAQSFSFGYKSPAFETRWGNI